MSSQLDEILIALRSGETTLDEACRAITTAVRKDVSGTRLWAMLIDSRITQQQLAPTVGRALIDAMESYEPDKTMWLAPGGKPIDSPQAVNPKPAAPANQAAQVATDSKVSGDARANAPKARFQDTEQLRAFLWDAPAIKTPLDIGTREGKAEGVAWMDEALAPTLNRVPPPRPMPGTTPVLLAPELGTIIRNRYRLDAHLGYGGIGLVFSATDLEAGSTGRGNANVTIKLIAVDLKREPQALTTLQAAIARTKSLRHPNIVSVYGVEHDGDRLFVVMEPLAGVWLGDQIRQVRKVGVSQDIAWPIIEGIANGLAYAHEQGIVHSDLSPYAVFINDEGKPKIMGFGLIHALPTSNEAMDLLDTMTLRAYSEAYTADTWATHATPHPADDLYPLGAIAYELLTGLHPYGRHSLTTARQKNLAYAPIPQLNRRASKLIARCLSFERTERPKNAAGFVKRMYGPTWLKWLGWDRFAATPPQR